MCIRDRRHGITNVAVLEADYIASGNTGRNTTIIRANYAVPEAIRFYDHSMKLYQGLEAETGAQLFYRPKGHVWLAHSEMGMRTERGQMLIGAEFDSQPSYSRVSSFDALRSYAYKITMLLPFLRSMRILRTWAGLCDISADWSPIMGETGVDGFLITTGWGTWGFKAIPAGGEALAERIATGRTPDLIAPFSLERFRRDHVL